MHSVAHAHCLAVVRCHFVAVLPSRAAFRFGLHLSLAGSPMHQAYRVHHFLNYGLVVRFRLLPTPPLDDAVAFCYGQPVLCPTGGLPPRCRCARSGARRCRCRGTFRRANGNRRIGPVEPPGFLDLEPDRRPFREKFFE
jgi:hypothetical protein